MSIGDQVNITLDGKPISGDYVLTSKKVKYFGKDSKFLRIDDEVLHLPSSMIQKLNTYNGNEVAVASFDNGMRSGNWQIKERNFASSLVFENDTLVGELESKVYTKKLMKKFEESGWRSEASYSKLNSYYGFGNIPFNFKDQLKKEFIFKEFKQQDSGEEELFKRTYYYPDGSVYFEHDYSNSLDRQLFLTPERDTIRYSYDDKQKDSSVYVEYSLYGLDERLYYVGDTSILEKYASGQVWSVDSSYKGKSIGTSFRKSMGMFVEEVLYNKKSSLDVKRIYSYMGDLPIYGPPYRYKIMYENGLPKYEGFVRDRSGYYNTGRYSDGYVVDMVDTMKVYFETGEIAYEAFLDTIRYDENTSWIKGYYLSGKLKFDGWVRECEYEWTCESQVAVPTFKVDYMNYYNEDGSQTLIDGNGSFFRQDLKRPVEEGQYLDGKRTGVWKVFDMNGNLFEYGKYVEGEKDGVWYMGDLQHINFIEECLNTADPDYEKIKASLEKAISIEVMYYDMGDLIKSDQFESEDEYYPNKRWYRKKRHRAVF
ncbi:MAG: hypothetical protein H6599_04800 [Flavobacteriales bacterium]|nr:hypothetical protein [Flavobacteriales bacterium]